MDTPALEKSMEFSVRIVRLYQYLQEKAKEYTLSKQLLRCGTSIGANLREAKYAQSKKDFISKASIALKETAETQYWLELLYRTDYLSSAEYTSISFDCDELAKLLTTTVKTAKSNL